MFYPFTANLARKEAANAKNDRENEEVILLEAYLSIAHVFIHRAAHSGYNKTSVYCPYSIRQEFCQALTEAGFIVSAHSMTNQFLVSWGGGGGELTSPFLFRCITSKYRVDKQILI